MKTDAPALQPDDCYRALKARDARFDGRFFTGVTSTGIYCRPVCRVRTPKRENCRFFVCAAQAESAGFRPCLRCRPELAPQSLAWSIQDASAILAQQAARWMDEPQTWGDQAPTIDRLAARLGVSDRHLRRIFETQYGVSPIQYLQTRRLLTAKQLLTDTDLTVTQVAMASGWASVRRFNAAFVQHYGLSPTQLRRTGSHASGSTSVRLGYRPPYDIAAMLEFFRVRGVESMEFVAAGSLQLGRTLSIEAHGRSYQGWLLAQFEPERCQVLLRVSDTLRDVLPTVICRVRALLDLDADPQAINSVLHASFPNGDGLRVPQAINSVLHASFPNGDGLRVPGTVGGFELAVRAVLGQQITVAAARTLTQRLVHRFGEPISTPYPALSRIFPTAQVLSQASSDALGELGLVRQRQAAIVGLARAVAHGSLHLHEGANLPATLAALRQLPGVGDWTAQYIAMRALRWPDAFPAGDVAVQKAMSLAHVRSPAREAESASLRWKPWRSYAVVRAWHGGL